MINADNNHSNSERNTLSHESSDAKPETVEQSEVVLYESWGRVARMRVVPLIWSKPARQMEQRDEQTEQMRGSASRKEIDKIYRLWIVADHEAGQQSGSLFFLIKIPGMEYFLLFSPISN